MGKKKKKILIVEKEEHFIKYYQRSLKDHEVKIIKSNKNINPDIQDLSYDIFVLKFTAKDAIRGFPYRELVNKIRKKYPKAKIIIASSNEDQGGELVKDGYCDRTCSKTNLPQIIKGLP